MGNCLVTKLKAVVDNDILVNLNQILLKVHSVSTPTIATNRFSIYRQFVGEIIGDGYFISSNPGEGHWSDGTNSAGKTYNGIYGANDIYVSNGDCYIKLSPKTDGNWISLELGTAISLNIEDLQYRIDTITNIVTNNTRTTGSLVNLLKKRTNTGNVSIDIRSTSCKFSLAGLLDNDVVCNIVKLWVSDCPNVTDKDAATIAAIKAKWPDINLLM